MTTKTEHQWVSAAPFRALLIHLLESSGLPWPILAQYAGVPPAMIQQLLFSPDRRAFRRIPPDYARRLLELDEAQLLRLGRLQYH